MMDPELKKLYITLLHPAPELPSPVKLTITDARVDEPRVYEFLCKGNVTEYRYGLTVSVDLEGDNGGKWTRHIPLTTPIKAAK
jgi:hypothetical protein